MMKNRNIVVQEKPKKGFDKYNNIAVSKKIFEPKEEEDVEDLEELTKNAISDCIF
jgi:hypothetical protein